MSPKVQGHMIISVNVNMNNATVLDALYRPSISYFHVELLPFLIQQVPSQVGIFSPFFARLEVLNFFSVMERVLFQHLTGILSGDVQSIVAAEAQLKLFSQQPGKVALRYYLYIYVSAKKKEPCLFCAEHAQLNTPNISILIIFTPPKHIRVTPFSI